MLKLDSFYYNRLLSLDKNDNQSLIWYKKAAESGYPTAMYNIAFYYENGIGWLKQDKIEAMKCYKKNLQLRCQMPN